MYRNIVVNSSLTSSSNFLVLNIHLRSSAPPMLKSWIRPWYLGHPSASRQTFCSRMPGMAGSSCFVRTGDRGVVTGAERYLYIVGRSLDVVIVVH